MLSEAEKQRCFKLIAEHEKRTGYRKWYLEKEAGEIFDFCAGQLRGYTAETFFNARDSYTFEDPLIPYAFYRTAGYWRYRFGDPFLWLHLRSHSELELEKARRRFVWHYVVDDPEACSQAYDTIFGRLNDPNWRSINVSIKDFCLEMPRSLYAKRMARNGYQQPAGEPKGLYNYLFEQEC